MVSRSIWIFEVEVSHTMIGRVDAVGVVQDSGSSAMDGFETARQLTPVHFGRRIGVGDHIAYTSRDCENCLLDREREIRDAKRLEDWGTR